MAKKSKTQRAKASARRQEKKERQGQELVEAKIPEPVKEKKGISKLVSKDSSDKKDSEKGNAKKAAKSEKKDGIFSGITRFFKSVKTEMHRVTWPTRTDVARWSGVVVVALVFFGLYVFVLDNWIVTPILMAISSLGA